MYKGSRRNRANKRRSNRPKLSFAKRVLSVMGKQRELKVGTPLTFASTDIREGITSGNRVTNQLQILSNIQQGTNETERIGNKITLKKIVIRGYYRLQFPVGNALNCRVLIRNMILRQKNINDSSLITGPSAMMNYNTILEPAGAYLGTIADYNTPVNRDSFVVKKQFKRIMTAEYDASVVGSTPALGTQETYVFYNYTMTFGKGKSLNYRTAGSTFPEDFPYFLAHSASYLGSGIALATGIVGFNFTATPYFYDD